MATLGLSMIVKNGGEDFRYCLASVQSVVDQIVIVDTGSTDDTLKIAREFGATIRHFTWCDNYAMARNAALVEITTDWVLSLDADEEVTQESAQEIHRLVNLCGEVAAYSVLIRHYCHSPFLFGEGGASQENHDLAPRALSAPHFYETRNTRLFKRDPRITFQGCVHEVIDHSLVALRMKPEEANVRIRHYGLLADESVRSYKQSYYRDLGHRKLLADPLNEDAWFLTGIAEFHEGSNAEALRCMTQAHLLLRREIPLYYIAAIHHREGRFEEALNALSPIGDRGDLGLQKNNLKGKILHDLNRLDEARHALQLALEECNRNSALGAWRSSLENQLGYVEVRLGNTEEGMALLRRSLTASPNVLEFHSRLVKACVVTGDGVGAAEAAEGILKHIPLEHVFAQAAALRIRMGHAQRADGIITRGLELFPESSRLLALRAS